MTMVMTLKLIMNIRFIPWVSIINVVAIIVILIDDPLDPNSGCAPACQPLGCLYSPSLLLTKLHSAMSEMLGTAYVASSSLHDLLGQLVPTVSFSAVVAGFSPVAVLVLAVLSMPACPSEALVEGQSEAPGPV